MKTLIFIIACFYFCSCTQEFEYQTYVQPELQTYVNDFINEASLHNMNVDLTNISIRFGTLPINIAGKTYTNKKLIVIDSSKVSNYEPVLIHELGHLILNRNHDDTLINNGPFNSYYKSVMVSEINNITDHDFLTRREYYFSELFNIH